jgi:hypothetical protein
MNHTTQSTNRQTSVGQRSHEAIRPLSGGLPVRTNLRAGLAWDDLDDKAQELFGKLSNAVSGLLGGNDASS